MYEHMNYESILQRMLDRIPSSTDKREGSIIFDALAPAAIELQIMYIELDVILREMFAETASREYLIRRASERAVEPFEASPATVKAVITPVTLEIPIGSRFSSPECSYVTAEKVEDGYALRCEKSGSIGNKYTGDIIPVNYIQGLKSITITEIIVPGIDDETDESIRSRFQTKVRKPSTSGNKYDYENWAAEVPGVGAVSVHPLANGAGTVKVVVTDSNMKAASSALIEQVYNHIEELRPVGATVNVVSVQEKPIDIEARIRLQNGVNLAEVQTVYQTSVNEYLKDNAFEINYISLARIGNLLLDVPGVEDYTSLTLNGVPENITLLDEEIAVLGSVKLGVI